MTQLTGSPLEHTAHAPRLRQERELRSSVTPWLVSLFPSPSSLPSALSPREPQPP